MKIKKWLDSGNLPKCKTTKKLIEAANNELDACESSEILRNVHFIGKNGQEYVMTVEAVISKVAPSPKEEDLRECECGEPATTTGLCDEPLCEECQREHAGGSCKMCAQPDVYGK